jgi:hypothetical protein
MAAQQHRSASSRAPLVLSGPQSPRHAARPFGIPQQPAAAPAQPRGSVVASVVPVAQVTTAGGTYVSQAARRALFQEPGREQARQIVGLGLLGRGSHGCMRA